MKYVIRIDAQLYWSGSGWASTPDKAKQFDSIKHALAEQGLSTGLVIPVPPRRPMFSSEIDLADDVADACDAIRDHLNGVELHVLRNKKEAFAHLRDVQSRMNELTDLLRSGVASSQP